MKTTTKPPKPPTDLGTEGKKLWEWVLTEYEDDGTGPLLAELCRTADRLAAIRKALAKDGRAVDATLITSEARLQSLYARFWRLCGLAEAPQEEKRRPGRPAGVSPRR